MSVRWLGGALAGAAAAGPIFVAPVLVAGPFARPQYVLQLLGTAAAVLIATMMVGFVIAFLPCLLGAALLATLGKHRQGVRHPLLWALTGGGGGAALGAGYGALIDKGGLLICVAALGATGAASALVCRASTRWSEAGDDAAALRG